MIRVLLVLLLSVISPMTMAHTLGIDKADLTEMQDGSYHLVSRVPPLYQPLITAPQLPSRCTLKGNPRGTRGVYEVRFIFTCKSPLTADDDINLPWLREGAMMTVTWLGEEPVTRFAGKEGGVIKLHLAEYLAGSGSIWAGAKRYTLLGIEHILVGIDHLLFVLALLLLVRGWRRVLITITAFTGAHSITLAAATLGWVRVPQSPVEAVIALSIVLVAAEIVHRERGKSSLAQQWPWAIAFTFGLLHGFGFAGALNEIGLPQQAIPLALLFFNIGVEIGQILFIVAVYLAWVLAKRLIVRLPGPITNYGPAYVIGTLAAFWTIQRIAGF